MKTSLTQLIVRAACGMGALVILSVLLPPAQPTGASEGIGRLAATRRAPADLSDWKPVRMHSPFAGEAGIQPVSAATDPLLPADTLDMANRSSDPPLISPATRPTRPLTPPQRRDADEPRQTSFSGLDSPEMAGPLDLNRQGWLAERVFSSEPSVAEDSPLWSSDPEAPGAGLFEEDDPLFGALGTSVFDPQTGRLDEETERFGEAPLFGAPSATPEADEPQPASDFFAPESRLR